MSWAQLSGFIQVLLGFCSSYRLMCFITTSASINTTAEQKWLYSVLPVFQTTYSPSRSRLLHGAGMNVHKGP